MQTLQPAGDVALILALASGESVDSAASHAGVSRATAYRRLDDPTFALAVHDERAKFMDRAVGRLSELALTAADTLAAVMLDPSAANRDRIAAARSVLEVAPRLLLDPQLHAVLRPRPEHAMAAPAEPALSDVERASALLQIIEECGLLAPSA